MSDKANLNISLNEKIFQTLANNNLLFHQCLIELIDNSIAASIPGKPLQIDIHLRQSVENASFVDVYVADNGTGIYDLTEALKIGASSEPKHRLNEHGIGLKTALVILTSETKCFDIWTSNNQQDFLHLPGPFKLSMPYYKNIKKESIPIQGNYNTIIRAKVSLATLQTLQKRGNKSRKLSTLCNWLKEYLGVTYRGYLNRDNYDKSDVKISIWIEDEEFEVTPYPIPFAFQDIKNFYVTLQEQEWLIQFKYGVLYPKDDYKTLIGYKFKYYYQQNKPTQGIDIRIGKKVILTHQLENIWFQNELTDTKLSRNNDFNAFYGELIIPELPPGILTTAPTKTEINFSDRDWRTIFNHIQDCQPQSISEVTSFDKRKLTQFIFNYLWTKYPEDEISISKKVWNGKTRLDIFRKTADGKIIIYRVSTSQGKPLDIYHLKMYWDGLLIAGVQPDLGVLFVTGQADSTVQTIINHLTNHRTPITSIETKQPYHFQIQTLDKL